MDTANILAVGSKGGGKTTVIEAILEKSESVLAITTKQNDFDAPKYKQAFTVQDAKAAMVATWPHFRVCLRIECEPDDTAGACQIAEDMIKAVYKLRRAKKEDDGSLEYGNFREDGIEMTIAVDEAHRTFPHHPPIKLKYLNWLMTEARVSGIHVLLATQYPTQIPVVIRNNIDTCYVGFCGDNALQTIKGMFKNHENVKKHVYKLYHQGEFVSTGDTKKPQIIQQPA